MQTRQKDIVSPDIKAKRIGEVLGLVEETKRDKDWILRQIKKHNLKIPIKSSMNSYEILKCCSSDFVAKLLGTLRGDDIITPEGIEMKTYHWFFSDIVAGSNPLISTKSQVNKIMALNYLIQQTPAFKKRDTSKTIILPTGDGQAIGFGDDPQRPLLLSIQLYKLLNKYNESKHGKEKLFLRIGIESGPIYFVKDLEGKDNIWGAGIIMARRVMDMAGDTQIFAGGRIAEELVKQSPQCKEMLHLVQNYETRYGEKVTLYNVYGEDFGSKSAPIKPKKDQQGYRDVKASSNFTFSSIEVMLEVTDPKTMQTHHTWLWDITNISKETKDRIFYFLEGQVPKKFEELKVKVVDGDKNKMEIGAISADRPYRKEFYIVLDKPIFPKQRIKLKLEYDWEAPERVFPYKFLSGAKKFVYSCIIPKEIDLKTRILKIDLGTGARVHASPPPTIKRLEDKIIINWEKSNILPKDAYEFYW